MERPSHEDLLRAWPKDSQGQPDEAVLLANLQDSGGVADMTADLLEAFGIPVLKRYRDGGQLGRLVLGFSGYGTDLYVPVSRLEEAQALLEASPEPMPGQE